MSLIISGTLLGTERRTGDFEPDDKPGTRVQFDYTVLTVHGGGSQVHELRLPKGMHTHPFTEGDAIEVEVSVPKSIKVTVVASELVSSTAA